MTSFAAITTNPDATPPGEILLGLGIVLLVLGLAGRLAARIGIPAVPLYLIAGLLLGEGGPLPVHVGDEFLSVGAEIGVVLLLLLLGLEYSPADLRDGMRATWFAGALDVVLNAGPGFAAGLLLGWSLPASALLAGVTYISSSGIIARLLDELGRIPNRETPIVLSILIMEDLAMAVYLPIVAVLVAGVSIGEGAIAVAIALAAVAAAFTVAFHLGERVSRALAARTREMLILTVLGTAFVLAGLADAIRVSAAVAAFLVGLTLSGKIAEEVRSMLPPLRDVFGGIFFVFFGMRVAPADLVPVLAPAFALAAIGVATKLATGRIAAARAGLGRRAQRRAGAALVARGEFSIVIAGLGVASGLEATLGPVAAAYVLCLAIVGPLIMRFSDRANPRG